MSDRILWPRTQVVGLWWLLIPLATMPLEPLVDAMWGNDVGRSVFYVIRGVAVFLVPEIFPAVTRVPWPLRLLLGVLVGLLVGALAAEAAFLVVPNERARNLHFLQKIDVATLIQGSLFFSFVTGGWLVGAVYFTFGRFRGSPWRKGKEPHAPRAA